MMNAPRIEKFPFEDQIAGALKPILPRQEFVHGLGRRIQSLQPPGIAGRFSDLKFILAVLAGLLSFSVFVVIAGRALITLLEKRQQRLPSRF
ncbi:MAG: hypothetical protein ABIJ39_08215 [Chloroflexota bacterium]